MSKFKLGRESNYGVYCIRFYGEALHSIKNEFKQQLTTGTRRSVFCIDLNEVCHDDSNFHSLKIHSQLEKHVDPCAVHAVLQAVRDFHKEYDDTTKRMNDELKFDLFDYWIKDINEKYQQMLNSTSRRRKKDINSPTTAKTRIDTGGFSTAKSSKKRKQTKQFECLSLVVKDHNRIGNSDQLSIKKFIIDEPSDGKLYIIILGDITEPFCTTLMKLGLPLEGIIHFVPIESNYEMLLGNNKMRNFILNTVNNIGSIIYSQRQESALKPVGIFTFELPVISDCLAKKYGQDIYDQLCWGVYDVDVLKQQYQSFYVEPFEETNVAMPDSVKIRTLYNQAANLRVQGYYQKTTLPNCASDSVTILEYLNSMLDSIDKSSQYIADREIVYFVLDNKLDTKTTQIINDIALNLASSFTSITKINRFDCLLIEAANSLLCNMLLYVDHHIYDNTYLACLDYNILRTYIMPDYMPNVKQCEPFVDNMEPFCLGKYAKIYCTDESCCQRLSYLLNEFDDYQINDIGNGNKLYTFRRTYNIITENDDLNIIPTRLCFRDFTLFHLNTFLKDLILPKMRREYAVTKSIIIDEKLKNDPFMQTIEINERIFIRPKSLKEKILEEYEKEKDKNKDKDKDKESLATRDLNSIHNGESYKQMTTSILSQTSDYVGLPPGHSLLKGYNLEDIRQEIRTKISRYYFDEGFIKLYEENWCFRDMNKELIINFYDTHIYLQKMRSRPNSISHSIRFNTVNNINISLPNVSNKDPIITTNYPNGLIIHQKPYNVLQQWISDSGFRNEDSRIYTEYGSVIVFFKSHDMILIMRYNGEVYRLYQLGLLDEEEEQELLTDLLDSVSKESFNFLDAPGMSGNTPWNNKLREKSRKTSKSPRNRKSIQKRKSSKFDRDTSKESLSFESDEVSHLNAKQLIEYPLLYLNFLCSAYDLKYTYLTITTTKGRCINVTPRGKIFETKALILREWYDYYANECLCQRSDGLKMIWTEDVLKCYHSDGTVISTAVVEYCIDEDDEFANLISQSSSHMADEIESGLVSLSSKVRVEYFRNTMNDNNIKFVNNTDFMNQQNFSEADEEHEQPAFERFTSYNCSSWLMQHEHYAGVLITWGENSMLDSIEVFTADDARLMLTHNIHTSDNIEEERLADNLNNSYDKMIDYDIQVWIGNRIYMAINGTYCEMCLSFGQETCNEYEPPSDNVVVKFPFMSYITDVFLHIVKKIMQYQGDVEPKTKCLHFIEHCFQNNKFRGFEFISSLPYLSSIVNEKNNIKMEMKSLQILRKILSNQYEWYDDDMKKFPRYRKYISKKANKINDEFPRQLAVQLYCKVPRNLRFVHRIALFCEPFEEITFKSLRPQMKRLIELSIYPEVRRISNVIWSRNNWKQKNLEHQKRLFMENHRKDLYFAMLKHKVFPKYFKFIDCYKGHVRFIDFFEFVADVCHGKAVPNKENNLSKFHQRASSTKGSICRSKASTSNYKSNFGHKSEYENQNIKRSLTG